MKKSYAKFGYDNYSDLLRSDINDEIVAHAETTYDKWTKYLLKHADCPEHITKLYAKSPVWYQRFAAVMPKNKFRKFKHLLNDEKDPRVLRALERANETSWGQYHYNG